MPALTLVEILELQRERARLRKELNEIDFALWRAERRANRIAKGWPPNQDYIIVRRPF